MRNRRRDLARAFPGAAERAATNLSLERLPRFEIAAGYQRMGFELDPAPTLGRFAAVGAIIVLPTVESLNGPLVFAISDNDSKLTPNLIIAPLLAFDRAGGRLGQGGGHYDRTIAALRARGPLFVIGLAYAGQEVEAVPREPHDQLLDAILTEIGYIQVRKDI
jgi:5-formyltetrahydrofolate cyclo-ligase